jgi:hypothetical protein
MDVAGPGPDWPGFPTVRRTALQLLTDPPEVDDDGRAKHPGTD